MELRTETASIQALSQPPKSAARITEWYFETGGLRRRLRLLAGIAETLSELHSRGSTCVNLSPHTIFISKHADVWDVLQIDTDSIRPASSLEDSLYTPGYRAPELVLQTGVSSSLSVAYAFAVIAFEVLVLVHPLLDDFVRHRNPELTEPAFADLLPQEDNRNRTSGGIAHNTVLSPRLQADFAQMFGPGLSNPDARPGLVCWAEHLHRDANLTLACPICSGHFFYTHKVCPWPGCHTPRFHFIFVEVHLWDPEGLCSIGNGHVEKAPGLVRNPDGKPYVIEAAVISANQSIVLTDRIVYGTSYSWPILQIKFASDGLVFEQLDNNRKFLIVLNRRISYLQEKGQREELAMHRPGMEGTVITGAEDQLHRRINFRLQRGIVR